MLTKNSIDDVFDVICSDRSINLITRLFRRVGLKRVIRSVHNHVALNFFKSIHCDIVHEMRLLGINMEKWKQDTITTTLLARNIVTYCNNLMRDLLELNDNELHCCLKVLVHENSKDDRVETWVRSEPSDGRPDDDDLSSPYLVCRNSVWSALLGKDDGQFRWIHPFDCFSCDNLPINFNIFQNTRNNWEEYYQATIVFPLRYIKHTETGKKSYATIGFLAFDSPHKKIFMNSPDIFMCHQKEGGWSEYHDLLYKTPSFHLGAIMADTLSMFLRPAYTNYEKKRK